MKNVVSLTHKKQQDFNNLKDLLEQIVGDDTGNLTRSRPLFTTL